MKEDQSLALIFLIVRPNRTREYGRQLLELLTSQGGIYPPEEVEVWKQGETFERVKFLPEIQNTILDEWEGLRGPTKTFNLLRWNPVQVQIIAELDDFANFDSFSLHVAKSFRRFLELIWVSGDQQETLQFAQSLLWRLVHMGNA